MPLFHIKYVISFLGTDLYRMQSIFVRVTCFTEVFVVLTSVCKILSGVLRRKVQCK